MAKTGRRPRSHHSSGASRLSIARKTWSCRFPNTSATSRMPNTLLQAKNTPPSPTSGAGPCRRARNPRVKEYGLFSHAQGVFCVAGVIDRWQLGVVSSTPKPEATQSHRRSGRRWQTKGGRKCEPAEDCFFRS